MNEWAKKPGPLVYYCTCMHEHAQSCTFAFLLLTMYMSLLLAILNSCYFKPGLFFVSLRVWNSRDDNCTWCRRTHDSCPKSFKSFTLIQLSFKINLNVLELRARFILVEMQFSPQPFNMWHSWKVKSYM